MLCPIDLTAALLLGLIYPFLCDRHKAQVRTGLTRLRERAHRVFIHPFVTTRKKP